MAEENDTTTTSVPTLPSPDVPTAPYPASCHCGAFTYTVTASPPLSAPDAVIAECNCSICVANGYLLIYVPNERIVFTKGTFDELKEYTFASKRVGHRFCGTCGSSCFIRSTVEDFMPGMTAVNVRMLEGVDIGGLKRRFADGRSI